MYKISFENQLVLITGGTRGIGANIVKKVVESCGDVIFTGTGICEPDWLEPLKRKYKKRKIEYISLDFTKSQWIDRFSDYFENIPEISVCINNAGINVISDIRNINIEDVENVVDVNLIAPAIITSKISKKMTLCGYGRIVNISSVYGIGSRSGRSTYSATKFGLIGQTKACALDLANSNILVNAVCPGFTLTDLTSQVLGKKGIEEIETRIPIGRLAETAEIVPAVLFLASSLNTYITGQTLVVDGGYLIE